MPSGTFESKKNKLRGLCSAYLNDQGLSQLTALEADLIQACAEGGNADGCPPIAPCYGSCYDAEHQTRGREYFGRVRAELIRFIVTDSDAQDLVHPRGLHLRHAIIERERPLTRLEKSRGDAGLDLDSTRIPFTMYFYACQFPHGAQFCDAKLQMLTFQRCNLKLLKLDRATIDGDLRIGNERAHNFRAVECYVYEYISMKQVTVTGSIHAAHLKVGPIQWGRQPQNLILNLDAINCKNVVNLEFAQIWGRISLKSARTRIFRDKGSHFDLTGPSIDGFQYSEIDDLHERLRPGGRWMSAATQCGTAGPLSTLAKALTTSGHYREARSVLYDRDKLVIDAISKDLKPFPRLVVSGLMRAWDCMAGYGRKPEKLLYWVAATWVVGYLTFHLAEKSGAIGPTSPMIHASDAVRKQCLENIVKNGKDEWKSTTLKRWTRCESSLMDEHTTFDTALYTIDVGLPLVDLRQESAWGPIYSPNICNVGFLAYWYQAFLTLFGWIVGLMLGTAAYRILTPIDND